MTITEIQKVRLNRLNIDMMKKFNMYYSLIPKIIIVKRI
jgi:hypothetical protein